MTQVHLLIIGNVQGVGYRKFVKQTADRLALTGWVQNLPDGSVEALVQGDKDRLEQLIRELKQGPLLAQVKSIDATYQYVKQLYSDFVIYR